MDPSNGRKKWSNCDHDVQVPLNVPAVKDEVQPQYGHYLHMLEKRNRFQQKHLRFVRKVVRADRLMRKLQKKDKKEIELEKKEKGFTLYLNSSFSGGRDTKARSDRRNQKHRSKITVTTDNLRGLQFGNQAVSKSANKARENRRNWQIGSVEFTTADGQRQRVKPPELLTGKYDDDFESSSDSDDSQTEIVYSMSSLNIEDDMKTSASLMNAKKHKTSYLKRVAAAKREEAETENRVTIKLEDVKKLRESLQMNKFIRHNLAMDADSEVEEEIAEEIVQDGSNGERVASVSEEIEEEISSEDDNKGKDNITLKPLKVFQPGNTLVLEFQPLPIKSVSKACRPLSANLRSTDSHADSNEEASAVIRALQEENKKVELFSLTSSSRPLIQPKNTSGATRPLPTPETAQRATPIKSMSDSDQTRSGSIIADSKSESALVGDSSINAVIERVLKMNPRQQKHLLQTLNHIDIDDKRIALSKTSNPLDSMTESWASSAPITDHFEVTLEIITNWGHSSCVGLTELEFFDQSGCLIPIKLSDVSVHGARGSSNKVEVLFNGKSKTTKEQNMWSCKFEGRQIEFSILMVNPNPGKQLKLGSVKVWNWNNKISNLDMGARDIRINFGGELLFSGEVDKGCGNQVFDYSKHIVFSHADSGHLCHSKKSLSKSGLSLNLDTAAESSSVYPSPCGSGRSFPNLTSPSRAQKSIAKEDNNSVASSKSHHTFRSISRSSQSSASSSGSVKMKSQSDDRVEERQSEGQLRSETRTLIHPAVLTRQHLSGSGLSSPEVNISDSDLSRMPEKTRSQTPMKANRVAARLNGRSSDIDNPSKSSTDSHESKPPLPPTHKSDEKSSSSSSRSVERSSINMTKSRLSPKSSRSEPHMSPRLSSTSVVATIANISQNKNMLAKVKVENDQNLVDKIKNMGQSENKRKKDIPIWLKGDETTDLPGLGSGFKSSPGLSKKTVVNHEDDDLEKQFHEEFEVFSQVGSDSRNNPSKSIQEEDDVLIPMKKIENSRAKWRNRKDNLEESWGSLSFFNKSHRGRVSIDIGDDELDSYLHISKTVAAETSETMPKLPLSSDGWSDEDLEFTIPELPSGKELVINIRTTWGDHHYVGLTGVELFTCLGEKVPIAKIWANPSDINVLPEYNKDPRVVTNIIDQVNRTRDDVHMWLAPFTTGKNHFIYITFAKSCKLALMRIWNYNKSRIHSYRGAKDVIITLDGTEIFKGEIARACGGIEGGAEAFGDTILFTTDENILEAVSKNDDAFERDLPDNGEEDVPFDRPSTAGAEDDSRPFTRAAGLLEKNKNMSSKPGMSFVTSVGDVLVYKADKLDLIFTTTWGDLHYLGLTGLEVVGSEGETIPLTLKMVTASPKDLRHLTGNEKDDRTLDKLLDGTNITCLDSHMWLVPFTKGENHTVTITFPQQTLVTGVRIWNYNKSPEDTYRGAKVMHVQINDRTMSPPEGYLLRKGPGICHFDFAQDISFSSTSQIQGLGSFADGSYSSREHNLEGAVQMPRGFIFQFQLFSTWGDQYYIGLNGLEVYDALYNKIELTETNIAAYPDSVNVLDNISNDARTPDKLVDGFNDTNDGRHVWLAPILPTVTNRVYVIFDQPTSVSMIKLWNYSKTINRGVKDFALLVDDLLVYNGTLQAVSGGAIGIIPTCSAPIPHHTILFTDNKEVVRKEKNSVISNQTEDQDIQLLNDEKIVSKYTKSSASKPVNQALRPKTSVTATKVMRR